MKQGVEERDRETLKIFVEEGLSLKQLCDKYIHSVDKGSRTYEQRGSQYRLQVEERVFFREVCPAYGEMVLDAGCGTGHYVPAFLERGVTVVGCDLSAECLHVCRMRCANVENGQLHLIRTSIDKLPFPSERFDRIICRHVLQHIPLASGRISVLQELRRTLKTDGWLHIVTYNRTVRHLVIGKKEGIIAKRYYYYLYSLKELISDMNCVFGKRPKVRGMANTLPQLPHLGSFGVWLDQKISILPIVSCLNAYVLIATVRK